MNEFDLIARYFQPSSVTGPFPPVVGVGDDCALMDVPEGMQLVVSSDTAVEGRHFFVGEDPATVAHRALAASLSDLAAMGAIPAWVSLNLTLPSAEDAWLSAFSSALHQQLNRWGVDLVGGDTTKGPLAISFTVMGLVERGRALHRAGASVGELIFVSGDLGASRLGLRERRRNISSPDTYCQQRFLLPEPRLSLGRALSGVASACIDVSDGLAQDLSHVLRASGVGATLKVADLPLCEAVGALPDGVDYALQGGEDYELCFTAPVSVAKALASLPAALGRITCIGQIEAADGLRVLGKNGVVEPLAVAGYQHFGGAA